MIKSDLRYSIIRAEGFPKSPYKKLSKKLTKSSLAFNKKNINLNLKAESPPPPTHTIIFAKTRSDSCCTEICLQALLYVHISGTVFLQQNHNYKTVHLLFCLTYPSSLTYKAGNIVVIINNN